MAIDRRKVFERRKEDRRQRQVDDYAERHQELEECDKQGEELVENLNSQFDICINKLRHG